MGNSPPVQEVRKAGRHRASTINDRAGLATAPGGFEMTQPNTRVVNGVTTRVLHNKDYVEVSERVRILHELRKAGEIKEFEMVESEPREIGARIVWRCSALIDNKLYIGNAEVKQDAPKNTPDGTNPFECAETSAFGRMLAFAGLGTVESIASYDEVMRGQAFVAVIEQPQKGIVEAGKSPKQLPQPQPMTFNQVYNKGLQKGKWTKETFPSIASGILNGHPINKDTVAKLTAAQIAQLDAAIAQESAA